MALSKMWTRSSDKYEPLPRYFHISCRVGSKVVVQGGLTKDFSEKSRQHLSSVVEIFDPYFESWEQRQVTGYAPSPGTYRGAASASLHDDLFSFGGTDSKQFFNTVHKLDTEKLCWSQVSHQNADGAPMPKVACGMIAFGNNSLGVFGGYGVPRGPTEPQSFIKGTGFTDGRGWTLEFHIYNLSEGVWSCPATTGDRPPPCSGLTFTAIDDRRAVLFGGYNADQGLMNDVFIIDLSTMNWRKLNKLGDGPWPEERSYHGACCLNYGQQFPQLLVSGGEDRQGKPLTDLWILNIERGNWRKVSVTLKARYGHSLTALSLGPGLTEVVEFGGSPEPWTGSDETQPKMADTILLQFRLLESSGESQWELLSLVDNTQRGSQQRIIEKLRHTGGKDEELYEDEEERKLYDEAMKRGYIESALPLVLFVGVTGSGKTLFKRLLLGQSVPKFSPSTPLTEPAVRTTGNEEWKVVGPKEMMDMVADAVKGKVSLLDSTWEELSHVAFTGPQEHSEQPQTNPTQPLEQAKHDTDPLLHDPPQTKANNDSIPKLVTIVKPQESVPQQNTAHSYKKTIQDALREIHIDSSLLKGMKKPPKDIIGILMEVDFFYLLDSGGQPPFREMLPHFVQKADAIVLMVKLNERLDFKPTIRYREKKEKEDKGYKSELTNKQILYQYIQAVQSHNSRVFVVGTHKDREKESECQGGQI